MRITPNIEIYLNQANFVIGPMDIGHHVSLPQNIIKEKSCNSLSGSQVLRLPKNWRFKFRVKN